MEVGIEIGITLGWDGMNGGLEYPRIAEIGTAKPLPLMTLIRLITLMSADLGERWESSEHRVIEWSKASSPNQWKSARSAARIQSSTCF
jgi:hypothetical protein